HWYNDGSFGFLVEDTAFLLHASVLSLKSAVMADLLSLPQPSNTLNAPNDGSHGDLVLNGVPFVVLHDRAVDFANVLDFIYPRTLPLARTSHLDADDLMGIVRFAGKYLIDDLKDWAVMELSDNHLILPQDSSSKYYLDRHYSNPNFCVEVIQFARECSLPGFLPFAFYALATEDWDRRPLEDIHCLDQLSLEDRHRIHCGRIALTRAVVEKGCERPEYGIARELCPSAGCRKGHDIAQWTNPSVLWNELLLHPIEELEMRIGYQNGLFCDDCIDEMQNEAQVIRDDLVSPSPKAKSSMSQNNGTVVVNSCSYTKHPQHWYEDGNFGFLVEETAFLVHRSVLSRKSSVMADLFALPQRVSPERDENLRIVDSSSVIDGVPYVVLHDKADDFANVLNLIYPDSVPTQIDDGLDAIKLLGVVRFAGKYLFDKIKDWGISKLNADPVLVPENDSDGLRTALQEGLYSDPDLCVKVILLSRECDLPQFLPLAFYSLATRALLLDKGLLHLFRSPSAQSRPTLPMTEETVNAPPHNPSTAAILDNTEVFGGGTYTKHSQHWYDDGSFGFLVESTAFLLHRTLMARRSSMMADMFGLPQRSASSPEAPDHKLETINGIPFVVLHDKAEDFVHVLDIIYTDISASKNSDLGATALMGVIRLAHKYLFDTVKEWALSQILSSNLLPVVGDNPRASFLCGTQYSDPRFCVRIIQFAREIQLPQFLPLAFYALATADWNKGSWEDFIAVDSQLSPEDRWRIQEGRLALTKALLEQAYKMPENGCTGERCSDEMCHR
ncbi:hypothetical protein FRC01_006908, partial [Tulasnella sp. 417]